MTMRRTTRVALPTWMYVWSGRRRHGSRVLSYLIVTFASLTAGVMAAPVLPTQKPTQKGMADDIQSLAGLKRVRIQVSMGKTTPELHKANITAAFIESRVRAWFTRAGIQIVNDDPQAPLFRLYANVLTERRVPNSVGFVLIPTIIQRVSLKRLDQELEVPTYAKFAFRLEHKSDAAQAARHTIEETLRQFVNMVSRLSRAK